MYSRQSSIRGGSKQEGNRQTDKPELLDDQNNRPEKAYGAKAFDVYWQKTVSLFWDNLLIAAALLC